MKIGISVDDLDVGTLTDMSEARICAVMGVPPILVGVKVGLARSTFSNAREAKRSFWDETLIPLYKRIEMRLNLDLAEDFNLSATNMIRTDFSDIRALQEDEDQLWLRAARGLRAGGTTINDFRRMVNLPTIENGDVLLIPANTIPVGLDGSVVFIDAPNMGSSGVEGQLANTPGDNEPDARALDLEILDEVLFPGETLRPELSLNGADYE
jgi:hypothetical protein